MRSHLPDLVALVGVMVTARGVWLIDPAWAYIIVGMVIIGYAMLMARE